MRGLAGVLNLDGGLACPTVLGESRLGTAGPVGMAGPQSHATSSGLLIALDGRIDNREELKAALADTLHSETDGELLIRAYQRWGEDSPSHILGDFAYVIWDPRERRLFCARDYLGIRPFCYFTDGRVFLWSSDPHQLLNHPAVPKRPNEAMVAEYLAADLCSLEETLYQGILQLPPTHSITVDSKGVRKQRYWDADLARQVRYKEDSEYEDCFRQAFREAVRCRLRSPGPVGAELSGGVDSSCVVGMCQSLFRDGIASGQGFETFALVFPGHACDETAYQHQVVQFWNLKSNEVPVPPDPLWYFDCARRYLDMPDHANCHMSDFPAVLARQKGIRVMLTGLGGDDWFTGLAPSQGSRARRALHRLRTQPSFATLRSLSAGFAGLALTRMGWDRSERADHWIPEPFHSRTRRPAGEPLSQPSQRFASPAQRYLYECLSDPFRLHCLKMKDRASARCGVEHRHPFHDRRLIELSLALPPDQLWRGGQGKSILRRAMKGLVPDEILQRNTKAEFSHASAQLFGSDSIAPVFHSLRIAEQGWVDPKQVSAIYQEFMSVYRSGNETPPRGWPLSMILGVELWFRAAFA